MSSATPEPPGTYDAPETESPSPTPSPSSTDPGPPIDPEAAHAAQEAYMEEKHGDDTTSTENNRGIIGQGIDSESGEGSGGVAGDLSPEEEQEISRRAMMAMQQSGSGQAITARDPVTGQEVPASENPTPPTRLGGHRSVGVGQKDYSVGPYGNLLPELNSMPTEQVTKLKVRMAEAGIIDPIRANETMDEWGQQSIQRIRNYIAPYANRNNVDIATAITDYSERFSEIRERQLAQAQSPVTNDYSPRPFTPREIYKQQRIPETYKVPNRNTVKEGLRKFFDETVGRLPSEDELAPYVAQFMEDHRKAFEQEERLAQEQFEAKQEQKVAGQQAQADYRRRQYENREQYRREQANERAQQDLAEQQRKREGPDYSASMPAGAQAAHPTAQGTWQQDDRGQAPHPTAQGNWQQSTESGSESAPQATPGDTPDPGAPRVTEGPEPSVTDEAPSISPRENVRAAIMRDYLPTRRANRVVRRQQGQQESVNNIINSVSQLFGNT